MNTPDKTEQRQTYKIKSKICIKTAQKQHRNYVEICEAKKDQKVLLISIELVCQGSILYVEDSLWISLWYKQHTVLSTTLLQHVIFL